MNVARTHLAGLVAAALAAAAGMVGLAPSPASAAQCSGTTGVNVVVDFNRGAGGGIQTACAANGGGQYASSIFPSVGFPLEFVNGGGFVCRVKAAPASADCSKTAPEDAYWGLFWAKKGSTTWNYSTAGVSTLRIPEGGSVAWAFQDKDPTNSPGVSPATRATPAPPRPAPTKGTGTGAGGGTNGGTGGGTKPARTSTPTPVGVVPQARAPRQSTPPEPARPSATVRARPRPSPSTSTATSAAASPSASTSPGDDASPASAVATDGSFEPAVEHSGLPVWVPIAVILVLALAAWAALWWRNRSGEA